MMVLAKPKMKMKMKSVAMFQLLMTLAYPRAVYAPREERQERLSVPSSLLYSSPAPFPPRLYSRIH